MSSNLEHDTIASIEHNILNMSTTNRSAYINDILDHALYFKRFDVVRLFIRYGARYTMIRNDVRSMLSEACRNGDMTDIHELCSLAAEHGDIDSHSFIDFNPLLNVLINHQFHMVEVLEKYGANLHRVNTRSWTINDVKIKRQETILDMIMSIKEPSVIPTIRYLINRQVYSLRPEMSCHSLEMKSGNWVCAQNVGIADKKLRFAQAAAIGDIKTVKQYVAAVKKAIRRK